jgi:predicted secreted protein
MKKNLLSLVSVFIALISLAQPPQSNGVSNGIKFNNFVETTVVLDSVQLQLMEKDEIPVADDVKQLTNRKLDSKIILKKKPMFIRQER